MRGILLAATLGLGSILGGCAHPPTVDPGPAPAPEFVDKGARARPHAESRGRYSDRFPDTRLVDHRGRSHRFYSDLVRDRTVVIQFFYTTCDGI